MMSSVTERSKNATGSSCYWLLELDKQAWVHVFLLYFNQSFVADVSRSLKK